MLLKNQKIFAFRSVTTFALPLDCFRIGVGIVSFLYFVRAFYEAPYFLGQDSLINHQLVQNIFWYTWQPLFHPSMSTAAVQIILTMGMLFSLFLVIGLYSRFFAFILYLMVVCIYRYQFLVFFVDDVIMHLLLFWCFLLPIGKTLNLVPWLRNKAILREWKKIKAESFILNLFLYNIALIYFVAGVSKASSRLWVEGVALFAILKLPMGWFSDYPFEAYEMWFRAGNYLALTIEPIFIFLVLLRPWSKVKMFLGLSLAFFHLFIILTLDIPFANLGCLILVPIIFRDELMDLISKNKTETSDTSEVILPTNRLAKLLAVFMIVFLTGAMTCALTQNQWRSAKRISGKDSHAEMKAFSADTGGKLQTFFYSGLWVLGLAQGYRLLDWIDERNFHQTVNVIENHASIKKEYSRSGLVPVGMRGSLILTYISDVTWMYVDPDQINELREDIKKRMSAMYCKKLKNKTDVEVWHALTRVDSFQLKYNQPEILLKFSCEDFKTLVI